MLLLYVWIRKEIKRFSMLHVKRRNAILIQETQKTFPSDMFQKSTLAYTVYCKFSLSPTCLFAEEEEEHSSYVWSTKTKQYIKCKGERWNKFADNIWLRAKWTRAAPRGMGQEKKAPIFGFARLLAPIWFSRTVDLKTFSGRGPTGYLAQYVTPNFGKSYYSDIS